MSLDGWIRRDMITNGNGIVSVQYIYADGTIRFFEKKNHVLVERIENEANVDEKYIRHKHVYLADENRYKYLSKRVPSVIKEIYIADKINYLMG